MTELTCPTCGTAIDAHPAMPCLDAWVDTLLREPLGLSSAYSFFVSHAFLLESHLQNRGIWISMQYGTGLDPLQTHTPRYVVTFWDTRQRRLWKGWGEDVPLAITRAAVKALASGTEAHIDG